jgi:hypothetical protein
VTDRIAHCIEQAIVDAGYERAPIEIDEACDTAHRGIRGRDWIRNRNRRDGDDRVAARS